MKITALKNTLYDKLKNVSWKTGKLNASFSRFFKTLADLFQKELGFKRDILEWFSSTVVQP